MFGQTGPFIDHRRIKLDRMGPCPNLSIRIGPAGYAACPDQIKLTLQFTRETCQHVRGGIHEGRAR